MRYQDQIICDTERATDALFRSARAVPEDKREWKVMDQGRTVLDQCQECADSPAFFSAVLEQRRGDVVTMEEAQKARAERAAWSLDECERRAREGNERLFAAMRSIADGDLGQTVTLPFGGGMTVTLADVLMMPYWNLTYHLGQINFIQTLLGDREMH